MIAADDLDLKLAEQVMRAIADAGIARRSQLELHTSLAGDLGLTTFVQRGDLATVIVLRWPVSLPWAEIRAWSTVADVVRSLQSALRAGAGA